MKKRIVVPMLVLTYMTLLLVARIGTPIAHARSVDSGEMKLRTYEWMFTGSVEKTSAGLDFLKDKIEEKVRQELAGCDDELGNAVTIHSVEVDLVSWVEVEDGKYDVDFECVATISGEYTSSSIANLLIAWVITHLWTIIQYIVLIVVLVIIVDLATIIFEPETMVEHYIIYDEDGNIIEQGDRTRPIPWWEDQTTIMILAGAVTTLVLGVAYLKRKRK